MTSLEIQEGLLYMIELPVKAARLQKLVLWRLTTSQEVLQELLPNLPSLTQLDVDDCIVEESDLDEQLSPVNTLR